MATFSNGESGSSVRTKLNDIINKVEGVSDINNNLTVDGNFTVTGDFTVQGTTITVDSATAQTIVLGDNDKMTFGAGSDLQIYHDGSASYISDQGTGNLYIQGANSVVLENTNGHNYLYGSAGGEVSLYHNNSSKLSTTSTGIDVTGSISADGLTFGAEGQKIEFFTSSTPRPFITSGDTHQTNGLDIDSDNGITLKYDNNDNGFGGVLIKRDSDNKSVFLADANGDISFYEDQGITPKFFWDASAEGLNLGANSVPFGKLDVSDVGGSGVATIFDAGANGDNYFTAGTSGIQVFRNGSSEAMRLDSNGRVKLHEDLVQDEVKATTTATTQTAIDTFPHASYDGAKVVITAATSADTYVTELLIATNGTTAVATEYGQIGTGSALATYDVDISGADVRILATPASTTSTTFRVAMTLT